MDNYSLPSAKAELALDISLLERYAQGWLLACEIRPCSPATMKNRRLYVRNLAWFLKHREFTSCGVMELRAFFAYFNHGHKDPGGRWGNPQETQPVKPSTPATYHRALTAMFSWIAGEGYIESSPMKRIPAIIDRPDDIEPFSEQQIDLLIAVAKRTRQPRRDEAIVWFLLDTGIRATELCDLLFRDIDVSAKKATIADGKGGKGRTIFFGKVAARALWAYLNEDGRELTEPVFQTEQGGAFTKDSLRALVLRLGRSANITSARCTPHTFRHTCAISWLRNGGSQLALMRLFGHTDLKMTARYVKMAAADVERSHREFSPADNQKGRKR